MRTSVLVVLSVIVLTALCVGQALCADATQGTVTVSGHVANVPGAKIVGFYAANARNFAHPLFSSKIDASGNYSCAVAGPAEYRVGVARKLWRVGSLEVTKSDGTITGIDLIGAPPVGTKDLTLSVAAPPNLQAVLTGSVAGVTGTGHVLYWHLTTDMNLTGPGSAQCNVSSDGSYTTPNLPAGVWIAALDKQHWCSPHSIPVSPAGQITKNLTVDQ